LNLPLVAAGVKRKNDTVSARFSPKKNYPSYQPPRERKENMSREKYHSVATLSENNAISRET